MDDATVGGDLGLETGALPRGKVVHAGVVAVVHVVVEAIEPIMSVCCFERNHSGDIRVRSSTGAGIARSRAAEDGAGLGSGIADRVTWGGAPSLEGVVQSDPVSTRDPMISSIQSVSMQRNDRLPGFVGESSALVIGSGGSTRDGRVEDDDTIILGVASI